MSTRKSYPTDVTDEKWALVAPYLTLMTPEAPQRSYALRESFNALRWLVRTGAPWRMLPHDFPPWAAVYQQTQRWVAERSFAWKTRFRRLVKDYERVPDMLTGLHPVAFACLMLQQAVAFLVRASP